MDEEQSKDLAAFSRLRNLGFVTQLLPISGKPLSEASAEWGKTIAAITTAASIFAVFGTDLNVGDLATWAKWALEIVLFLAFAGGVLATLLAFLAQFDDGQGYKLIRKYSAIQLLRRSIWAAIIGAICIALAPVIIYLGQPKDPGSKVDYFVTFASDKRLVCGKLAPDLNGNLLIYGTPLTDVDSFEKTDDGCPALGVGTLTPTPQAGT